MSADLEGLREAVRVLSDRNSNAIQNHAASKVLRDCIERVLALREDWRRDADNAQDAGIPGSGLYDMLVDDLTAALRGPEGSDA